MKQIKRPPAGLRRPLRDEAIQALLRAAKGEWRGIILFGIWTGRRLAEVVEANWRDVDLKTGTIRFRIAKLDHTELLPLAPVLRDCLAGLQRSRNPDVKVFPSVARQALPKLKEQFRVLAAKAGSEVWGFDALRLTFAYKLGLPSAPCVMQMLGQQSPAQELVYTYTHEKTLKAKLAKLRIRQRRPKPK